jgi:uncharacterized protein
MIPGKSIETIEKKAKKYFINSGGCHDWSHIERVRALALKIGKKERADLGIIEAAALLHDIGRKKEAESRGRFCHAEISAELAAKILKKLNFKQEQIKNISQAILAHRFRNNHYPETIEAKVLYDADKLDSIGAIGVGRAFLFAGGEGSCRLYTKREKELAKKMGHKTTFHKDDSAALEYEVRLKYIKNKMLTKEGKRIAAERDKFMKIFFRQFWSEINGKK